MVEECLAQPSNVLRLLADIAPFQLPSTPPSSSSATALSTCLCGSTPTIVATHGPPRLDAQIERHMWVQVDVDAPLKPRRSWVKHGTVGTHEARRFASAGPLS